MVSLYPAGTARAIVEPCALMPFHDRSSACLAFSVAVCPGLSLACSSVFQVPCARFALGICLLHTPYRLQSVFVPPLPV